MKKTVIEAVLLTIVATIVAFAVNAVSPNDIALVGTWYDNRVQVELEVPPSYYEEMDTLLTMHQAFTLWNDGAIFIDTREPYEFEEGHIPGALNLPFEEWDDYWGDIEPLLKTDDEIICYCGGLDCELSLFAARELITIGYPKAYIFFGGIHKWVGADLPLEVGCGDEAEEQ
ncbi:MAG: rhodanese-like domain-containing protein [candidate division Zixibacteria bacterium]|nr:rhodanese-like domain-containing protein [candidate division Zixibacteria bacterium]